MSSTTENDSKAKINSAASDDLWVSYDSTSHPGLKFYVNKLTGIKVWNITDSEIAFAEKADKNSQEPVQCPTMDHTSDARIYNKQIINNQFSNQLPNLLVNPVSVYSPFNVWENGNPALPTYTLMPTALAEACQQLIPLANSLQNGNLPIAYNVQQDQLTTRKMTRTRRRHNKWLTNRNKYVQNQSQRKQFSHTHHCPDLRKKIVARRRSLSATFSENEQEGSNNTESRLWNNKHYRDDGEWEKESIQMNLAPLKLLTSAGSESVKWYIVVDTDVILNNFNYVNNMATADPDCQLLIPYHVMSELRSHAAESSNVQVRRIYRFLNEQIVCGYAILGTEVAGRGPVNMVIMTCINLSTPNNPVILISNNPDILKYKSNTKYIHVFTIQDVKDILANRYTRLYKADSPTLDVKITVPNDIAAQNLENTGDFSVMTSDRNTNQFKADSPTTDVKITVPNDDAAQNFENTGDYSVMTFRRTLDSIGHCDDRICTQNVSGELFPEYFELHQIPPKPVSEENFPHTTAGVGAKTFLRPHSQDNFTATFSRSSPKPTLIHKNLALDDDVGTKNMSRHTHSVGNVENYYSQSPPKPWIRQKNHAITDVGDRNMLARSVEHTKSKSPPKPWIRQQNDAITDVGDRNMLARSVEHTKSQSPPKPWTRQQNHAITNVGDTNMLARPVEHAKSQSSLKPRIRQQNDTNTDISDRNMLAHTVEHTKSQNSPKPRIRQQNQVITDVGDRNMLARSVEHTKSQSPSKPRIRQQNQAITDVGDRNMLARSMEHTKSQSPTKLGNTIPHKDLADTDAVTRTHSEENLIANSPFKSARGSDYINTMTSNENQLNTQNPEVDHSQSPSKLIKRWGYEYSRFNRNNQSPFKADDESCSSSSATSGHVSLDTIRMKHIISMKRLTSTDKMRTRSITSNTSKRSIKSAESMQQIANTDTSASRSSYENDSETSRTKNIAPNITVEETSLSAISNSESSHSEKAKSSIKKDVKKVSLRSVVMFNVGCQSMEDVLKTRCDEWVFRFVQIMEEVLRVKLQEKLPFDNKEYPAIRDLQEAARSVIKKFSNNFSVVEAANKLSFILYKTSDEDGKIAVNIQPSDYMEMYSYGVFLVDTFLDMSADCKEEDCKKERLIQPKRNQTDSCSCYEVKTASDSLKKLLYDIQNANLESFVDHPRDLSAESAIPDPDEYDYVFDATEEIKEPEDTECQQNDQQSPTQQVDRSEQVANIYNLRSQKRKSQCFEDEEVPPKVPMSGKGESFFKSLQLQRTIVCPDKVEGNSHVKDMNINKQNFDNHKWYNIAENKTSDILQNGVFNNLQIHFSKDKKKDCNSAKSQLKVVRNFTVNADIERKVKARQNEAEYEYYSDNEDITKTSETSAADKEVEERVENNDESNKNFTYFMGRLVQKLGEHFSRVTLLCDEYVKTNELTNVTKRKKLRAKMEEAYSLMGIIHNSLSSISNRDLQSNGKNIQKLFEMAKIKDCIPDDELCREYRYIINKCKEKSEEFHNTIQRLLKMVRV